MKKNTGARIALNSKIVITALSFAVTLGGALGFSWRKSRRLWPGTEAFT